MKRSWVFLKNILNYSLGCLLLSSCSSETPSPAKIQHVIVSTDAFFDDFLALAYLLEQKDIFIDAITVSEIGFCSLENGVKNVSNFLAFLDMSYIPISSQSNPGICHKDSVPKQCLEDEKNLFGVHLKNSPKFAQNIIGSDLIAEKVRNSDEKITLLCLTTLNDVAEFLINYPDLHQKIEKIVIMGGSVYTKGNINTQFNGYHNDTAEYNIALDPCSAQIVFNTKIRKVLCPLDVTDKVPLNKNVFQAYQSHLTSKAGIFIKMLIENVLDINKGSELNFWDAVAASYLIDPSMFETKQLSLVINTTQGPDFGKTTLNYDGSEVEVCTSINQALFYKSFFNSMKSN